MHGCIWRSSIEESNYDYKKHKKAYWLTKKLLGTSGVQHLWAHNHTAEVVTSSDANSYDGVDHHITSDSTSSSSASIQYKSMIMEIA